MGRRSPWSLTNSSSRRYGYIPGYNPYPDNNGNGDPAKAEALLQQAGYPHGVSIKLLYSTLPPMPRLAESLQSSLTAGGFHVRLVPVPQDAFFASYLSNPASSQRDAWDAAAPRYIPDWFGNNGRVFLQTGFTYPGNGSRRLRRLLQPGHKLDHQQSARSRERQRCRRPVGAGSAPDHKRQRQPSLWTT